MYDSDEKGKKRTGTEKTEKKKKKKSKSLERARNPRPLLTEQAGLETKGRPLNEEERSHKE